MATLKYEKQLYENTLKSKMKIYQKQI